MNRIEAEVRVTTFSLLLAALVVMALAVAIVKYVGLRSEHKALQEYAAELGAMPLPASGRHTNRQAWFAAGVVNGLKIYVVMEEAP